MKFVEDEFYRRDKHEYQLESNKDFLDWFKISLGSGIVYDSYIHFSDMEGLIDHLNNFYHIKYPDFLLEDIPNNPWGERIRNSKDLDINLTVPGMILRLPWKEAILMNCPYCRNYTEYEIERGVHKSWLGLDLYDKRDRQDRYGILFEPENGTVIKSSIKSFEDHNLVEILDYLKLHPSYSDYHELEEVVDKNLFEIKLRRRLLQLTALKILYTSSNPRVGYKRAKKFIEEMNNELSLLLSTKEIDRAYRRYEYDEKFFSRAFTPVAQAGIMTVPKGPKVLKMSTEKRIYTD